MTKERKQIINFIATNRIATRKQIDEHRFVTNGRGTAKNILTQMVKAGLIRRMYKGVYALPKERSLQGFNLTDFTEPKAISQNF